jgi:SanA protein
LSDNKTPNLYYIYRINAAEELYKSGKTETIIISGDKNDNGYNEPMDMMRDLLKRGIPQHAIKLDYSGFRTLDSVYRLKYESDVNDVVIITQKFHLQRALFLAQFYNIKAVGFQAQGTMTRSMVKRELLAKPKVILDIFVFNMKPKNGKVITRQQVQFAKPQHKTLVVSVAILLLITAWFFIESLKFQKYR